MKRFVHFLFLRILPTLALCASAGAGQRVLYLGDSLSMGTFGVTLDQRLREAGFEVYTSVTGGATPYYWLKEFENVEADIGHWQKTPTSDKRFKTLPATPKLEDLIQEIQPQTVIVQTGVNLYSTLRSKRLTPAQGQEKVESLVQKMARAATAGGARLYWITPPSSHFQRYDQALQQQMLGLMQRTVGPFGRVFDSYAVTSFADPYPETDGIHYGPKEAAAWGELVATDAVATLRSGKFQAPRLAAGTEVRRARIVEEDVPPATPNVTVEIRLVRKSNFETPSEITYQNALAIYEWEVLRVVSGRVATKKILVAHTVVRKRTITSERNLKLGKTYVVELVPLSTYPQIERWETIDHISNADNMDRIIYIPKI